MQPFIHICRALSLGTPLGEPVRLSGGYTHRMYALTTPKGHYALKLLNPEIMQRPGVMDNYARAEAFEALLEEKGLPILPALTIDGRKLHCVDGQYLYVFAYYNGRALRDSEITPVHCVAMGKVLAHIHACARRELPDSPDAPDPIDWPALTSAVLACPSARAEGESLLTALPMLERVTQDAMDAASRLPRLQALCHNDMDAKNVLWNGSDYRIIDLECLDWADPAQEMLDLSISWAGWPQEESRFKAFIRGYMLAGGSVPSDAALLYDSRRNHIDWLAYNARRAVLAPFPEGGGSEGSGGSDPEEARIGREQITETLNKIASDQHNRPQVLRWMQEVQSE